MIMIKMERMAVALILLIGSSAIGAAAGGVMQAGAGETNKGTERAGADQPPPAGAERGKIRVPDSLVGQVRVRAGQPVVGARVVVEFVDAGPDQTSFSPEHRVIRRWEVASDDQGRYRIDAASLGEQAPWRYFRAKATGAGYAESDGQISWDVRRAASTGELQTLNLQPGPLIRGRCIDPEGHPVAGVVIYTSGSSDDGRGRMRLWFPSLSSTGEDGRFEFAVPNGSQIELLVMSTQFAPSRVSVPTGTTELTNITMKRGTSLTGRVVSVDDKPIAGVVVALKGESNGPLTVNLAAKTDGDGKFRFSPFTGRCALWVTSGEYAGDRPDVRYLESDVPPPSVMPQLLSVDEGHDEQKVVLRASPISSVRGRVLWPDGHPASGVTVFARVAPEQSRQLCLLANRRTDDQGGYTLDLPKSARSIYVEAVGRRDAKGVFHSANPTKPASTDRILGSGTSRQLLIERLDEDRVGVDWTLQPPQSTPAAMPPQPTSPLASPQP